MKTIAQFVRDGIHTPSDLKDALQTAMRLEFSTIPPYLCAEWSIESRSTTTPDPDPDDVTSLINRIVEQEMFHFALAGNMLSAIGGTPSVANPAFLPTYPTDSLPGGIPQDLPVDLKPLSKDQLKVFMQIETPEFPAVELALRAAGPATIGAFYDTIADGFGAVSPAFNSQAHFVDMGDEVFQVKTTADAIKAINRIKGEGEGALGDPDQPGDPDHPANPRTLAHFYVFKEIFVGNVLSLDPQTGKLVRGNQIRFPTVLDFQPSTAVPNPSIAFNQMLSQLLTELETCWTKGSLPDILAMSKLRRLGKDLISRGIRPEFQWTAPT
jgi:hypothetical protein